MRWPLSAGLRNVRQVASPPKWRRTPENQSKTRVGLGPDLRLPGRLSQTTRKTLGGRQLASPPGFQVWSKAMHRVPYRYIPSEPGSP